MERALPVPERRGLGHGRIEAIQMPKDGADAARDDRANVAATLAAAVADGWIALGVAKPVEVRGLFIVLSPSRGLGHRHDLFILAVNAGAHTFKVLADTGRQAESARVLGVELLEEQSKGTGIMLRWRSAAAGAAHVAEPFDGHVILADNWVDAVEVERACAAIAADQLAVTAA